MRRIKIITQIENIARKVDKPHQNFFDKLDAKLQHKKLIANSYQLIVPLLNIKPSDKMLIISSDASSLDQKIMEHVGCHVTMVQHYVSMSYALNLEQEYSVILLLGMFSKELLQLVLSHLANDGRIAVSYAAGRYTVNAHLQSRKLDHFTLPSANALNELLRNQYIVDITIDAPHFYTVSGRKKSPPPVIENFI